MSRGRAWPTLRQHAVVAGVLADVIVDGKVDVSLRVAPGVVLPYPLEPFDEPTAVEAMVRTGAALKALARTTNTDEWPTALEMDRAIVQARERGDLQTLRVVSALRRLTSVMAEASLLALPEEEDARAE